MGIGELRNGKLNMVVVAKDELPPAEWAQWRRAISKASEILYDASDGQLQFGDVYFADDGNGEETADIVLYSSGDPAFNRGRFGLSGSAMHLMPYVKSQVLTVLHELGHSLWGLGEEYSQPTTSHPIDTSAPAPDVRTIPIQPSGLSPDQLVDEDADAILTFNGQMERHTVVANTDTSITVDADFSGLPTDAEGSRVSIQRPAECAEVSGADFCIMNHSRRAAGTLAPDGTWTPAADPVTEFCSSTNHDPDGDTDQEARNGGSCWETIVTYPDSSGFSIPDPAAPGPTTGSDPVDFFVLDPDPRFAIVLDRSGSMADGNKLPDAKHGANYWAEFCAVAGDQLSVIWYNHGRDVLLPLTDVGTLTSAQREQVRDDIDAITPDGATAIRDALLAALTEISTPPSRAATQVAVMLTDGRHNTPLFSTAQQAIPDLRENGLRVYALGVGEPDEVDMPTLDDLAQGTGGRSYAVGTNQPNEIERALVEINAEVRGGIIDTLPVDLPDAGAGERCGRLQEHISGEKERPPFEVIAKLFEIELGDDRWIKRIDDPCVTVVRIPVEKGAERCSFTVLHPEGDEVWLYLVDPDGAPVDIGAPGHDHVRSSSPHEFSLVAGPKPGWWTVLLVRTFAGPPVRCRVVAGVENHRLHVYASANAGARLGERISVEAGASYESPLTGLHVTARLTAPSGAQVAFTLTDVDGDGERTGSYRASFPAEEYGRYEGAITVEGDGAAWTALGLTRLSHAEDDGPIDLRSAAPPFRRTIPIQALVRRPGSKIEDDERETKYIDRQDRNWSRPTRLASYVADVYDAPRPRAQT